MTDQPRISLLLTSGNGPVECRLAVQAVLDLMTTEAEGIGLDLDASITKAKQGYRSAVVVIHGNGCAAFARKWTGTIQWRSKSTLRPHHKRANWFIGVFALKLGGTSAHTIAPHEVSYETFRAGGPGGQHQNTTDSAVRAIHRPTGLTAVAREMRSQHRNKALAFERLLALSNAQSVANGEAAKAAQNALHQALERGNPVRYFKGPNFREEKP